MTTIATMSLDVKDPIAQRLLQHPSLQSKPWDIRLLVDGQTYLLHTFKVAKHDEFFEMKVQWVEWDPPHAPWWRRVWSAFRNDRWWLW